MSTTWHQVLYSLTGVFTPRYLPFELYYRMIDALSPYRIQKVLDDKNLYRQLLHSFNIPQRLVECSYGVYYLPELDNCEHSVEDVLSYLGNISDCIIKPSKDSSSGNGVQTFSSANGIETKSGLPVRDFLKRYGKHFVVERKVIECDNLRNLNPSSCNTLRIHTARIDGKTKFLSAYIRIGRAGKVVDNAHQGGICVSISPNGELQHTAATQSPYERQVKTDSGILIQGYKIDNFDEMVQTAVKAHSRIPQFGIMGWDICTNSDNEVVIIEFNPNPDMRMEQLFFESTCLGEWQDDILKSIIK